MKFKVTFQDTFENCESEEQAYNALLEYLNDVVKYKDVTAFSFSEIKTKPPKQKKTELIGVY